MIEPNQATIDAYNHEALTYITKTPHHYQAHHKPMLNWIDTALTELRGKSVLEIGSATPRDATYMRDKGYSVQTSDASEKFVDSLQAQGEPAILLNALTDTIPKGYDLIFANAVAPHFTPSNLIRFLDKTLTALPSGGRLAFNLKIGSGDTWINEKLTAKRFIHYWRPEDIKKTLASFDCKVAFFDANAGGDLPNHHWINIIVEKP
jgi:2-polyprenyl-3-methyl-5-hydroxy-6-metoxy-1,4-benzoquinol methylase